MNTMTLIQKNDENRIEIKSVDGNKTLWITKKPFFLLNYVNYAEFENGLWKTGFTQYCETNKEAKKLFNKIKSDMED